MIKWSMLWSIKFLRWVYLVFCFFRKLAYQSVKAAKLLREAVIYLMYLTYYFYKVYWPRIKRYIKVRWNIIRTYKAFGFITYVSMDNRTYSLQLFKLLKPLLKKIRIKPASLLGILRYLPALFTMLTGIVLPLMLCWCTITIIVDFIYVIINAPFFIFGSIIFIFKFTIYSIVKLSTFIPLYGIVHFVSIFLMIAYFTLMERKIMASIQRRKGPNVNGFHGLLQPLADGLKLLLKEIIIPARSNKILFIASPIFFLTVALSLWSLIPFGPYAVVSDPVYSNLMFIVISGTSIYGIIFAGWASNSKYPFLGALRAVAQMISYEVVLGFIILIITLFTGSLNFFDIVNYQNESCYLIIPLFPLFIIYFIVILAETNRAPFDLAEAESELVAGYNVEYSGILFAMFFLAEYSNMIVLSAVGSMYFFGGWHGPFSYEINFILKILFFMILFVVVRAVLPRYRYDQLMAIGWRNLLPLVMALFLVFSTFFFLTDSFYQSTQVMHSPEVYHLSVIDSTPRGFTKYVADAVDSPYTVLDNLRDSSVLSIEESQRIKK